MIHLVVSRPAEARPLRRRYGLEAVADAPFPTYLGDGVALAVGGEGKTSLAAATAHLFHAAGGRPDGVWLNLGVAGHGEMELGRCALAHKVVDAGSDAAWYPPLVVETPLPSAVVITVERLRGEYHGGALYDSVAAGFFAAAERFATAELVHALKIVADNHGAALGDGFSPQVMEDLVESKVDLVAALLAELAEMGREVSR